MEKRIPRHSLVFCPSEVQSSDFPFHERLSTYSIKQDLIGDESRLELSKILFEELRHRLTLKLSIGERVVVVTDDLSTEEKYQLSIIALDQGATVIDYDSQETLTPFLIPGPGKRSLLQKLKSSWEGITVVGDIHGDYVAFREVLTWARSRRHFVWLLGDVIDYGPKTLETMTAVYNAVMSDDAAMIVGNHERKIARWLSQGPKTRMRLSEGNKVTVNALIKLSHANQRQWSGRFRSLLAHSSLICQMDHITLVHAAAHPSLWSPHPDAEAIEQFALYGEGEHKDGKFRRCYNWVDEVPMNKMVFVGHDVLHDYPTLKVGAKGGQVVFLDTGCGKGGHLSSADLRFTADSLRLECFKRY